MEKFHFTCKNCGEQFNVEFEYMPKKEVLTCPNCSNTLPDDSFKHLKTVVTSLKEYDKSKVHNHKENENHFDVTIQ